MSEDEPDPTKREVPARKAWMAPTVGADTVAPARQTLPPSLSISVFDPPERRFVEKSELGRGGMGRVVEAVDRALGRSVAIKQSLATASADLARFEREVRITARLQHPSVIPILDVGRDPDGRPFYIMRKIEGEPLADRVTLCETVGDRLALVSSFLGAVDAAAYAHAKRIIHRDIKPWNILLGPFGETLLIDWGIARELDVDTDDGALGSADTGVGLTRLGVAQGTPGFLAPEQARGEVVDARADVFSLGATLFYVLANKLPYGRISATEAIDHAAEGRPPDFSVIPDEVPRELLAILVKSMAPDPAARYSDAGELAADLRRFLAGQLVAAHEYSTRERVMKWVRQHRVAVSVSALALLIVAVVGTLSLRQVFHDRDVAHEARTLAELRGDDAIIDRARLLAATDPTSSIATLRELRRDSERWPTARAVVRTAVLDGIERRVASHPENVSALAFSPNGKLLASGSTIIEICDLATQQSRQVDPKGAYHLRWRDDRTLVFLREGEAGWIDVETGASHRFQVRDAAQIEVLGYRVIIRTKAGAVIAIGTDRLEDTLLDGAHDIDVEGDRLAIIDSTKITIIEGTERREIPLGASTDRGAVSLSPDGKRVAAVTGSLVREWMLDNPTQPRSWVGFGEADYAGDTLYARNNYGFSSLDQERPRPRLTTSDDMARLGAHIVPFRNGAVLVSDNAELAYVDRDGLRRLAHRRVQVSRTAVDHAGTLIAISYARDVVVIDLSRSKAESHALPKRAELLGVTSTHAVIRSQRMLSDPEGFADGMSMIDLATFEVTPLDPRRMFVGVTGDVIAGGLDTDPSRVTVWSNNKRVLELERIANYRIEKTALVYVDFDGAIWRQPIGGARISLGHLPPNVSATLPNGTSAVRSILVDGDDVILNVYDSPTVKFFYASGKQLELGIPGFAPSLYGRTRDGAWYAIDYQTYTLYRSKDGVATKVIPDRQIAAVKVLEDRVLAVSRDETVSEIELDGHVVRVLGAAGGMPYVFGDDVIVRTSHGVDLIGRSGATRGTIRLPGSVMSVYTTGRRIVAQTRVDDGMRLVVWQDRIPDDPDELRRYLDTLTNARLPTGSDVLIWDP